MSDESRVANREWLVGGKAFVFAPISISWLPYFGSSELKVASGEWRVGKRLLYLFLPLYPCSLISGGVNR